MSRPEFVIDSVVILKRHSRQRARSANSEPFK